MRSSLPFSEWSPIHSSPWQLEWKIRLPGPTQEEAWIPRRNSRIPPHLEKNHVLPSTSQDEALCPLQHLKRSPTFHPEVRNGTWHPWCDPKSSATYQTHSRGTPRFPPEHWFLSTPDDSSFIICHAGFQQPLHTGSGEKYNKIQLIQHEMIHHYMTCVQWWSSRIDTVKVI